MKKYKVAWVPFSVRCPQHKDAASIRLRVDWPIKHIPETRKVDSLDAIVADDDIVVLQKVYGPRVNQDIFEIQRNGKKVIVDICDPDWRSNTYVIAMLLSCDAITVPSPAMKDLIFEELGIDPDKITVIEDAMDLEYHSEVKKPLLDRVMPKLVWFGNCGTIQALNDIIPDLEKLTTRIEFQLVVISDEKTKWPETIIPLDFYLWRLNTVNDIIRECDVAINPKRKGEEYKSNNKTLTAWACGIPCVEVWPHTNTDTWMLDLLALLESPALRMKEGTECRKHIEQWYNTEHMADQWKKLFKKLMKKGGEKE